MADTRDMYAAHGLFRREFGLMPGLVRAVADGDQERTKLVAEHVELVNTVLTHHHGGEDKHMWPRLLERAPLDAGDVARKMSEQHHGVEVLDEELATALAAWKSSASAADRAVAAAVLDRLADALWEHMATEELLALPLIERYITAAEWGAMVQDAAAGISPEVLPLTFGMMMYETDPALVDEIVENLPPEVRPVIKQIAQKAFDDYALLIHGTTTPPRGSTLGR